MCTLNFSCVRNRVERWYIISFSNFLAAISGVISDLAPRLGCVYAAIALHNYLLKGVLRLPLTFFDTTPVGRILSRFSKDIDSLDNELSYQITDVVYVFFEVN